MPRVQTGTVADLTPDLWARLRLLESVQDLADPGVLVRLEQLGIPRQEHPFVRTLHGWAQLRLDPDAAFALWLLRCRQDPESGAVARRAGAPVVEPSPTVRLVQLAAALGEDVRSDPSLAAACAWLQHVQLPDGSIPDYVANATGEVGTSARALHALVSAGVQGEVVQRLADFLRRTVVVVDGETGWPTHAGDGRIATGASGLALHALRTSGVEVPEGPAVARTLVARQGEDGGWPEFTGGSSTIHNTFTVLRALLVQDAPAVEQVRRQAERFWRSCLPTRTSRPDQTAFSVRVAALLQQPLPDRTSSALRTWRHACLGADADAYSSVALMGLAAAELHASKARPRPTQRPPLAPRPPSFLLSRHDAYELLYAAASGRRTVQVVNWLRCNTVLERVVAALLAVLTSATLADTGLFRALSGSDGLRSLLLIVPVLLLLLAWTLLKTARHLRPRDWVLSLALSGLLAAALTATLTPSGRWLGPLLAFLLVVDVVRSTASRADILERLVPG